MPDVEKKRYPSMSPKNWHVLRKKFRTTLPREISNNYLATILNMSIESARANVMSSLKLVGIVDQDNKPTNLAVRLRDDDQYAKVCEEIRHNIYDNELLDIAHDLSVDKNIVRKWFANRTGLGENAARKYTDFYLMLLEADPTKDNDSSPNTNQARRKSNKSNERQKPDDRQEADSVSDKKKDDNSSQGSSQSGQDDLGNRRQEDKGSMRNQHTLHINFQIHISPESSPEQIDQIFSSMSRHLKELL